MKAHVKTRWTEGDISILIDEYPYGITNEIAKKLNRSASCVQKMAQMHGLKKTPETKKMIKSIAAKAHPSPAQFKPNHGYSKEVNGKRNPTYTTWRTMHQRCEYENHKSYADYGGRGISVCDSWGDFAVFLNDMGFRPKGMTLGRIDNEKNYTPENCRWETYQQQARNRRSTRYVEAFGEKYPLCVWAEKTGIPQDTLSHRLKTWGAERALTEPLQTQKARHKNVK